MLDVQALPRAVLSVEGVTFSAAADLFVLHTNDFFGSTVPRQGVIIPLELHIAQCDQVVIPGNEHIGVSVRHLAQATVVGTATTFKTRRVGRSELADALDAGTNLAEAYNIDVMCGTLVTAADGEETLFAGGWNLQIPFQKEWVDHRDLVPMFDAGDDSYYTALAVRLHQAPSTSIEINASLMVAFLGGADIASD